MLVCAAETSYHAERSEERSLRVVAAGSEEEPAVVKELEELDARILKAGVRMHALPCMRFIAVCKDTMLCVRMHCRA